MVEDTLSRRIKTSLKLAGVDTSVFIAHPTRSAATSAAARQGAPLGVILRAANWKYAGTFAKFYNRDIERSVQTSDNNFASAVLKSAH